MNRSRKVSDKINGRTNEIKRTVADSQNGYIVDMIAEDLAGDILNVLESKGKEATAKEIIADKNRKIKEYEKLIQITSEKLKKVEAQTGNTIEDQSKQISDLRAELYDYNYKIGRLKH